MLHFVFVLLLLFAGEARDVQGSHSAHVVKLDRCPANTVPPWCE